MSQVHGYKDASEIADIVDAWYDKRFHPRRGSDSREWHRGRRSETSVTTNSGGRGGASADRGGSNRIKQRDNDKLEEEDEEEEDGRIHEPVDRIRIDEGSGGNNKGRRRRRDDVSDPDPDTDDDDEDGRIRLGKYGTLAPLEDMLHCWWKMTHQAPSLLRTVLGAIVLLGTTVVT